MGLGALVTGITAIIMGVSKFMQGAWIDSPAHPAISGNFSPDPEALPGVGKSTLYAGR